MHADRKLGLGYSSNYGFTSSGLTGSCGGGMVVPIYVPAPASFGIITSPDTGAEAEHEARYWKRGLKR
jgi:hypothetical protein